MNVGRRILKLLRQKPRQTPKMIAKDLDAGVTTVRNALVILSDVDAVKTQARGLYVTTKLGKKILRRKHSENGDNGKSNPKSE